MTWSSLRGLTVFQVQGQEPFPSQSPSVTRTATKLHSGSVKVLQPASGKARLLNQRGFPKPVTPTQPAACLSGDEGGGRTSASGRQRERRARELTLTPHSLWARAWPRVRGETGGDSWRGRGWLFREGGRTLLLWVLHRDVEIVSQNRNLH